MSKTHFATRDHRIDFVRGLALMMIFINHIPGNIAGQFTSRNFGFSDAAEIFVLLAGVAAAFAYLRRFEANEAVATSLRVWRRAGFLYSAHVLTSVLAVALFAASGILATRPDIVADFNLRPLFTDPAAGFLGLASLTHFFAYFNILPLYVALLAMLPLVMLLYRVDPRLLLSISVGLYLAAGFWHITLPSFPDKNAWYFNPLSWQLLFVAGFFWGAIWRSGLWPRPNPYLFWAAAAYLAVSLVWVRFNLAPWFPAYAGFGELWGFSKTYLAPFRLLHVLALAYMVAMSPIGAWLRRVTPANPLAVMGRHALPVFCTGSILSLAFYLQREIWGGSLVLDLAAVAVGLALQVALACFLDWQDAIGTRRPATVLSPQVAVEPGPAMVSVPVTAPAFILPDVGLPPAAAGR